MAQGGKVNNRNTVPSAPVNNVLQHIAGLARNVKDAQWHSAVCPVPMKVSSLRQPNFTKGKEVRLTYVTNVPVVNERQEFRKVVLIADTDVKELMRVVNAVNPAWFELLTLSPINGHKLLEWLSGHTNDQTSQAQGTRDSQVSI